jgi:hypothetical protein
MGMYQYVHDNPANGVDVLGLEDDKCPPEPKPGWLPKTRSEWLIYLINSGSNVAAITSGTEKFSKAAIGAPILNLIFTPVAALSTYNTASELSQNWDSKTYGQQTDGLISVGSGAVSTVSGGLVSSIIVSGTLGEMAFGGASFTAAFGTASKVAGTLFAGTAAGTAIVALGAGLAIAGTANEITKLVSGGQSLSDLGEGWNIPIFTKGVEWLHSEQGGEYYTFGSQRAQRDKYGFWTETQKFINAKNKVNARGSRGGGSRWIKPEKKTNCPQNNGGGSQKGGGGQGGGGSDATTEVITSNDPNEIIGPDGEPNKSWVSVNDRLPYTILYENDKSASAPAKYVKIISPIHPKMDAGSFQLGSFGFNSLTFTIPPATASYYERLDCRDSLGLFVDIIAGYDVVNNHVFWEFQSIDPITLLPPSDPLKGFLLLQDSLNSTYGHGFVNFSIKPVTTAQTSDSILARADIIFDGNDTIPTNIEKNTIDALPPVSSITDLPNFTPDTEVTINYTGADDPGGSGVKWYSIFVSDNDGVTEIYIANFRGTDTTFKGVADHNYKFYISATDSTGNTETMRLLDSVRINSGEIVICPGGSTSFDSKMSGVLYQWQVDTGTGFTNITNGGIYSGAATLVLNISNAPTSMYGYLYRCLVNGSTYSEMFLLKFGMNWEGTISNTWENPANWSCGSLPDANTDVTINGGKANYPQVNSNITIRTLRMNAGSSANINSGFTLTVIK